MQLIPHVRFSMMALKPVVILRCAFVSFPNMAELQSAEEILRLSAILFRIRWTEVTCWNVKLYEIMQGVIVIRISQQRNKAFEKFNGHVWVFGLSLKGERGADNSLSQKSNMAAGNRKYTFLSYGVRYLKNVYDATIVANNILQVREKTSNIFTLLLYKEKVFT